MEAQLREILGEELRRRHGVGMMEGKLKPVHIANALMREEHCLVGRMSDLKQLMIATASRETPEQRLSAVRTMLDRNRERWGRLGEEDDLKQSLLVTRVLPLLRTILATDNAAYGSSPEFSSFSSPTTLTVTRDVSDDHAGAFIHRLWSGKETTERLPILEILKVLTDPANDITRIDDLAAVLAPLADDTTPYRRTDREAADIHTRPLSQVEQNLRHAANDLGNYEAALNPNPIATLQRVVLLASLTVFFHGATRGHDWAGFPQRFMLIDASNARTSEVAGASEGSVTQVLQDAREYLAHVLREMLESVNQNWANNPETALVELFAQRLRKNTAPTNLRLLIEILDEFQDTDADLATELPLRLVEILDGSSGRSLDGFLRLLGVRCGLLYPQQKNPIKRCVPMDRTLEVIVASTFDLTGRPLEYREFLDALYDRWSLIVGGRLEDGTILADAGTPVPSAELRENSERFLGRLQALGLARRLADSVAVVGLMEENRGGK